jgi:DNA-binding PadR family transcriptional regulator
VSVKQGLLALLAEQPMYGYQLRSEFESRTGSTWPLNIGQVYTTLSRLVRDGLVAEGERGDDGSVVYALTTPGRDQVQRWWTTPVTRSAPDRDELAIKLALAVTVPGVDVRQVVQRQRAESLRALQEFTRLSAQGGELAWHLVLDNLIFATEAEVRWLDHVEARLVRQGQAAGSGALEGKPPEPAAAAPAGTDADAAADVAGGRR